MLKRILKSATPLAFALLSAAPLAAQMPLPPLPGLDIRIARTAPPPMRQERMSPRPGRDHVWARGSWDWQGNDWAWSPGRWDRPERRGSRWVYARYAREGSGYRYEPSHWSHQHLVEGDDYRRWKADHHHERDGRNHDKRNDDEHDGHDRSHDRDNDHDHHH